MSSPERIKATRDVGGGRRVATVTGPGGNVLGLVQDTEEVHHG
jgi:hypothetical protein